MILCWREIRPNAGKTTENEFVTIFLWNDYPEKRIQAKFCAADQQTCVFGSCECTRVLSESAALGSQLREDLQQTYFQLFCQYLALFLSNKVLWKAINQILWWNTILIYLPNLSQLNVITTQISPFLYNRVESFSVGRTSILTCDLNDFYWSWKPVKFRWKHFITNFWDKWKVIIMLSFAIFMFIANNSGSSSFPAWHAGIVHAWYT